MTWPELARKYSIRFQAAGILEQSLASPAMALLGLGMMLKRRKAQASVRQARKTIRTRRPGGCFCFAASPFQALGADARFLSRRAAEAQRLGEAVSRPPQSNGGGGLQTAVCGSRPRDGRSLNARTTSSRRCRGLGLWKNERCCA